MGYEAGLRSENYFMSIMNQKGLPYDFVDDWFDFEVCGQKVEVKSTQLSINQGKGFSSGRYDFTKPENREKQFAENIWICFIVRCGEQFMIQGFCKAKALEQRRYISIPHARSLKLISLEDWIKKVNNRKV